MQMWRYFYTLFCNIVCKYNELLHSVHLVLRDSPQNSPCTWTTAEVFVLKKLLTICTCGNCSGYSSVRLTISMITCLTGACSNRKPLLHKPWAALVPLPLLQLLQKGTGKVKTAWSERVLAKAIKVTNSKGRKPGFFIKIWTLFFCENSEIVGKFWIFNITCFKAHTVSCVILQPGKFTF